MSCIRVVGSLTELLASFSEIGGNSELLMAPVRQLTYHHPHHPHLHLHCRPYTQPLTEHQDASIKTPRAETAEKGRLSQRESPRSQRPFSSLTCA
jgi:hypothetical protein